MNSLALAQTLKIELCLTSSTPWKKADHVFVDASENGFGTIGYPRFQTEPEEPTVCLMMVKARVAPLRTVTIPRLELCTAFMGTRMAFSLLKELRLTIDETVFHRLGDGSQVV